MYFLYNRETKQFSNFLCRIDDNCFQMLSSSHWSMQLTAQQLPYETTIELWKAPEYLFNINSVVTRFKQKHTDFKLIDSFIIRINNETINKDSTHLTVSGNQFIFKCKVLHIDGQINLSLPYIYL